MTLFSHQQEGVGYLLNNPKGYLAHKPGTGKTRTLITAATLQGLERPLIVTPAIVRSHWKNELRALGWSGPGAQIYSYDEIVRGGNALMKDLILKHGIDGLILDEAHYLKHATSRRTLQLLGKDGYARRLETVWPASGTPLPRNPAEIWTLLSTLRPDIPLTRGVKTLAQFISRYCVVRGGFVRGQWREKIVGVKDETLHELQEMLSEFWQVRENGQDVPKIWWQVIRLNGAADVYDGNPLDAQMRSTVRFVQERVEELASIAEDRYVARMRRRLGELKVGPVAEMLSSQLAASEEKVAVFAHHRSVLAGLRQQLMPFGLAYIDGDTSEKQRDAEKARFINDPRCRVFIGQNIACSTGMDGLQHVTNRAVLVEPDWLADVNYQLGHRVARLGSTFGSAIVQMIALADTLDESIVAQNKRETEMVAAAMAAQGA